MAKNYGSQRLQSHLKSLLFFSLVSLFRELVVISNQNHGINILYNSIKIFNKIYVFWYRRIRKIDNNVDFGKMASLSQKLEILSQSISCYSWCFQGVSLPNSGYYDISPVKDMCTILYLCMAIVVTMIPGGFMIPALLRVLPVFILVQLVHRPTLWWRRVTVLPVQLSIDWVIVHGEKWNFFPTTKSLND